MADTSIRNVPQLFSDNKNISNTNRNIYITFISLVDFVKYLSVLLFFIFTLQGRIVHCVSILLNQYPLIFFRYGY